MELQAKEKQTKKKNTTQKCKYEPTMNMIL